MPKPIVTVYTDYKSPYAFVAKQSTYQLEQDFDIELDWLPYSLDIADYLGSVDARSEHQWRRVRYSYMDARRYANKQGLTMKGPRRIYNGYYSSSGLLFAKKNGFFRVYNDIVFEKFWQHELDIDEIDDVANIIESLGFNPNNFREYAQGIGRDEHALVRKQAEERGVFGVPMFVLNNELFWGGGSHSAVDRKVAGTWTLKELLNIQFRI